VSIRKKYWQKVEKHLNDGNILLATQMIVAILGKNVKEASKLNKEI
jgi:hypothetical protein